MYAMLTALKYFRGQPDRNIFLLLFYSIYADHKKMLYFVESQVMV